MGVRYSYRDGVVFRSSGIGEVLGVLDQFLRDVAEPEGVDIDPGAYCGQVRRWPLDLNRGEITRVCEALQRKREGSVECLLQHYVFVVRGRIVRLAQLLRDKKIGGVSGPVRQRLPAGIVSIILEMGDVHLLLELTKLQIQRQFQSHVGVRTPGGCSVILQEIMRPLFGAEVNSRGVLLPKISEADHFCSAAKFGAGHDKICNWPLDLDHTDFQTVSRTMETACYTGRSGLVQDMIQHYKELLRIRIEQVAGILHTKFPDDVVCKILVFGSETNLRYDLIRIQILHGFRPAPLETLEDMLRLLLVPTCGRGFVKQPLPASMYQSVETSGGPSDEDDDPQGFHSEQPGVPGISFSPLPPLGLVAMNRD